MWNFIKLDTRTGRLWQVQYSTQGFEYRFQSVLSDLDLSYDESTKPNRFELYPTNNRRLKKYGPGAKYGYRVRDGFCFALSDIQITRNEDSDRSKDKHEALYVVFKTFMNESNMRENQLLAIDQEHIDAWQQCVDHFQREGVDGKIELVLEK